MNSRAAFNIIFSVLVLILLLACVQSASAQRFIRPARKVVKQHPAQIVPPQAVQEPAAVAFQYDEDYPDPKALRPPQRLISGKAAGPVNRDRYAEISEPEYRRRVCEEQCRRECCGQEGVKADPCPLCVNDPKTPCGECKMCKAGFPCERTLCRHCVQQRSQNMCNSCDLSAGDEPCGTCDACREHRSDPCEHADDGHGPRGEFNPYKEPRHLSVIPRPILDMYNNGARKFPVYYNPAPYYRPHWNPSLYAGYARPYTFRWSCPLCYKDPCNCDKPGFAGQVPYAYACKNCNRNPCACTQDICNVNKEMNPKSISTSLSDENKDSTRVQDTTKRLERRQEQQRRETTQQRQSQDTQQGLRPLTDAPQTTRSAPSDLDDMLGDDSDIEMLKNAPKTESRRRVLEQLKDLDDAGEDESFRSMPPTTLDTPGPELHSPNPRRRAGVLN